MKGKIMAGFVLGIVAIVLGLLGGWASVISLPAAIVGLVLSVMGGKEMQAAGEKSNLQTAAFVIGIVAVVLTAISFVTCGLCTICVTKAANDAEKAAQDFVNAFGK